MTPQEHRLPRDLPVSTKICGSRHCDISGIAQPIENFAKNRSRKDGLQSFCRKCLSRVKKARERNFPRIPDDQIKICCKCRLPKKASEFYRNRTRPDGVGACCKSCAAEDTSVWVRENMTRYSATSKAWASSNKDKSRAACRRWNRNRWAMKALGSCRTRAAKKGITFDMVEDDLLERDTGKLPVRCPVFPHIVLDYNAGKDQRLWASVDKIVPELGYTSGNVWVISKAANTWKSNGSNAAERRRIVEIMTGKAPKAADIDASAQMPLFDL
jgi:hypothetical protein